ncbi:putative anti-sigma regulatory factor, serine/threonine protein kinase [Desulfovibrio sp. X2]|uniref:ATP-binding protein n=1 Tax=Desulfovibrio sp. X2 TaxID=941449 RepID=UPI000358DC82|nr:ATP-binding protein [Desulfovibrio sp. X2]EPR41739.1 putative anti-sigma regulatory factor, serine/threonine protein kinase [Desulfovibrio sp. X2]
MARVVRRTFTLRNSLQELDTLREHLEAFASECGLTPRSLFELNLILDELLTNVITYGFPGGGDHVILMDLGLDDDTMHVVMADDGEPFDPRQAPEPEMDGPLESRSIGGLGIHLVKSLVQEIDYQRAGGRNVLKLTKRMQRT